MLLTSFQGKQPKFLILCVSFHGFSSLSLGSRPVLLLSRPYSKVCVLVSLSEFLKSVEIFVFESLDLDGFH